MSNCDVTPCLGNSCSRPRQIILSRIACKKHAQAARVWFILTYIAAETSYTNRHLSTLSDDSPPRALPLPLWRALNQAAYLSNPSPQTLQPHSRFPSPTSTLRVGLKAKLGAQDLRFENGMLQGKIKSVLGGR